MPQEKISLELDRAEAIALTEYLASTGDPEAEMIAIGLRNQLAMGHTWVYEWIDFEGDEPMMFRAIQQNDEMPLFEYIVDEKWAVALDSEGNGPFSEGDILLSLAMSVLHSDDEGDEGEDG